MGTLTTSTSSRTFQDGQTSRTRQRYRGQLAPIQAHRPKMAEGHPRGGLRPDLQVCQEGHDPAPEIPEDLFHLMKKAVAIHKHLAVNRKDMDSKFRMVLIEARIHRLVRYYIRAGQLPPSFKYEADKASAIVS